MAIDIFLTFILINLLMLQTLILRLFRKSKYEKKNFKSTYVKYRMRTIKATTCIFSTPIFTAVYNQEWLILEIIHVINKNILQKNPRFIIKSRLISRAGYNDACRVLKKIDYISYYYSSCPTSTKRKIKVLLCLL